MAVTQALAAAMSHYSFPLLKNQEILLCLNELSIEAADDDLTNPTSGKVQLIYSQLIELLLNERREEMLQPKFAGMAELEFPELHDESVSTMAFIRACQRLLSTCGINDFTLTDLTKPESKRLRRNISAVINFAKFREERLAHYVEFTQGTDALAAKKLALEQENERLLTELSELTRKRQQEAPEEERLTAENAEREKYVREVWNQQTTLQKECSEYKAQHAKLHDERNEAKFKLLEAKSECEELEGQIVADPKKLKAELHALHEAEKSEKATLKQLEAKTFAHSKQLEAVESADKAVDEVLALQHESEGQSAKLKEATRDLAQLNERAARDKAESGEQVHKIRSETQRNQRMKEKIERLEEQHKSKQANAEAQLTDTKLQWAALDSERSQQSRQMEENESAVRELKDQILKAKMAHEAETARVVQQQAQLASQVRAYHENLMAAMAAAGAQTAQQVRAC